MKKVVLVIAMSIIYSFSGYAQEINNPILTAVPFLQVIPDARSGGMADMGVSTRPDANSQYHNPAKYAFSESQFTLSATYTPWLRNLTNDVFLGHLTFSNRINESSAWAASFNYFSVGRIETNQGQFDQNGRLISTGTENPNDLSVDVSYALRLSDEFSMAVKLGYVRSDLSIRSSDDELQTINSIAVGISGYYQSEEKNFGGFNGRWRGGFNIANLGPKVERIAGQPKEFIPTNLKIGGGFDFILDDFNTIAASLEFNKLLVPTPSVPVTNSSGELIGYRQDDSTGFLEGVFSSFGDAPDGFSEELKEFTWALGAEYMYDDTFAFRAGYFNESDIKGPKQFFSLGAGFKFKSLDLDMSYLLNTKDINNPLDNTLRFSLTFNFGDVYEGF